MYFVVMKKIIFIIIASIVLIGCRSSKGCGCPNPYGYIENNQGEVYFLAYHT